MTQALVRAAAATDIPAIAAIYSDAVRRGTASFEVEPPSEGEMRRRFAAICDAGYPYIVAETGGRVAGYAYASAYRTRPAYRFTVEDSIYLAPDMQGKGIGRALLGSLVGTCTEKGFRLMLAVIGDSANNPSIRLHRNLGFTFCGTIHSVGYKFDRWLDSVIMQLPLGEGDSSAPAELGPASHRR